MEDTRVAIIGGGLVGSLCASYLARNKCQVEVFEFRGDMRKTNSGAGKSINLALSHRGLRALKKIGIEDPISKIEGIPMRGRMIHSQNKQRHPIYYDPNFNQCPYSVKRKKLNELLLTEAEKWKNVTLHFDHKLKKIDLNSGEMKFIRSNPTSKVKKTADLIIGADGAYSTVRRAMIKEAYFNYSQTFIEHGYMELYIPRGSNGESLMELNYLHIWPRGHFMMIALPNMDASWNATLFMPLNIFDGLNSPERLVSFFKTNFPDAIDMIGERQLSKDYFSRQVSSLVSIKCSRYHSGKKAVIIGDAAHAMVPFYGQGMNAALEDCIIFDDFLVQTNFNIEKTLIMFSTERSKDGEAICDLAMYNYIEMRDLVSKRSFLWRKYLDVFLHKLFPNFWIPLYYSVTFSAMRYSLCIKNKEWQDKVLQKILLTMSFIGTAILVLLVFS